MVGFKSFFVAVAAFCLIASADVNIQSMDDFLAFSAGVSKGTYTYSDVYLDVDLDFANVPFNFPIAYDSHYCFCGKFFGQGHTIKNLKMNTTGKDYKYAALFHCLMDSSVSDLAFDKSCEFTADYAGSLVGWSCSPKIVNVKSEANVNGAIVAGGFSAIASHCSNPDSDVLIYRNCSINSSIRTTRYDGINCAGGFIGEVKDTKSLSLEFTSNRASVNFICEDSETVIGGLVGFFSNSVAFSVKAGQNQINTAVRSTNNKKTTTGGLIGSAELTQGSQIKTENNIYTQSFNN